MGSTGSQKSGRPALAGAPTPSGSGSVESVFPQSPAVDEGTGMGTQSPPGYFGVAFMTVPAPVVVQ